MLFTKALFLCCLALLGCKRELTLNKLPELPPHWQHIPGQGIDSRVGRFVSSETNLIIHYDIGELAGEYATSKAYPNRKWLRSGQLAESSFRYLLNDDDTLYVTFPDEGPANFWVQVDGPEDIDYVLEMLARHRHDLLGK